MGFAIVLFMIVSVIVGAHRYMWVRLVKDVSAPGTTWRRTGTVLAFALPLLVVSAFVVRRAAPFEVERVLAWPGYMWVALMIYIVLALLVGEAVRPLLLRALTRRDARRAAAVPAPAPVAATPAADTSDPVGPAGPEADSVPDSDSAGSTLAPRETSRRLFVARTVGLGAALVGGATVAGGAYSVLNGPTLEHRTVPLAKLPRRADGYRIAVVSDIHIGPILGRAHTQRIVDLINSTQPDMVTIVGDLVDASVADIGPAAEPLRQLRSRHGTYFVTGNHEYFGDARSWIEKLKQLDVHPLENARVEMPYFDLAGVNDIQGEEQGEGPDFAKALGDRDTSRASVLLAHQPVLVHDAVRSGVDLQLSGHSHGGQMWPGPYLAELANPTVAGLEAYGDTQLFVTKGAGAWGPPVRVGADSDVTIVKLASKQA